ncbi:MAG: hypothetical protein JWN04_4027, partial [Myxococcaceae bacterium]|nr:hypothetical protein [Myxococcaceae bacterium]
DATSALFQSEKPLAPQTDYQISAVHVAADGTVLGNKFTSAFKTGVRTLAPLSFATAPSMNYEEAESERYDCVADACGKQNCQPTDEMVHTKSVRIAVPAIVGGVDLKPYAVSAQLVASFTSGQAPAVATSDTVATQAGKRSFLVVQLPALPSTAQGCVTISATDVAGHTLKSEPVCTSLPADDAPYDDDVQGSASLNDLSLTQSVQSATGSGLDSSQQPTAVEASAAQGCAVGQGRASLGTLGWLAAALTLARLRSRSASKSSRRASRDDHADRRA